MVVRGHHHIYHHFYFPTCITCMRIYSTCYHTWVLSQKYPCCRTYSLGPKTLYQFFVLSNEGGFQGHTHSRQIHAPPDSHHWDTNFSNIYHHLVGHGLPVMVGSGGSSWFPSDSCWWANPAWSIGPHGHDITSGLLNDMIMTMATLAMGHGQMATSGLPDDITAQNCISKLLTDMNGDLGSRMLMHSKVP